MARTLSKLLQKHYLIPFVSENSQIRCLAHVVNLVVQKMLSALNDAEDPDIVDYYLGQKFLPIHYDPNEDEEAVAHDGPERAAADKTACENFPEEDKDEFDNIETGLTPVQKLRLISRKVVSSPQHRSSYRKHVEREYHNKMAPSGKPIKDLMLIRDVATRWGGTHAMIERALLQKKVRATILVIQRVLTTFTKMTATMSLSKTPTLPWVLPLYELMKTALETAIKTTSNEYLKNATLAGLVKLMTYYTKARGCQFNVIATICHPGLCQAWFEVLGDDAKQKATDLFEHVYKQYEKNASPKPKATSTTPPSPATTSDNFLSSISSSVRLIDAAMSMPEKSELEQWYSGQGGAGDPYHPLD
ncbi:hypothetical protein OBBRIDRAFT_728545 [Obba rivulosa]|uniref:Uncharacterized protein n=1 Tax=Obba rivulosa TaxID=1052685 RepID=A0A8E2DMW0_9APHY|nr:hypothetical protein OBBRIDRAFT_728545 [Obba rivulosa]